MNIEDDPFAAPPPRRTSFNTSTTRRPNFPAPLSPTSTARAFLPSSTNNNNNNGYDGKPSSGPSSASLNGLFPPNTAKEVKPGSAGAMRAQLENLIEMKQQELVRAGRLGQQILSQQSELEARVKELSEVEARSARGGGTDSDGEELGEETRARLQALGEAVGGWEKENEGVWEGIRGGKTPTDDPSSSSTNTLPTSSSSSSDIFSSSTLTSTTTTQSDFLPPNHDPSQSRRTRNAAHRTNDIEFATEIGQSLLVEVRRLQTLLSERDKALEDSHREVEEGRGREEGLREVVRTLEGSAGTFRFRFRFLSSLLEGREVY
ncbi:hypothetical protein BDY24DRAFT_377484 [Mrakia frigida]|uniref:uncharacterized protein n=1 Tax=Mrakia frigida TaxID=29902 RepID=UPI003FCC1E0A